VGVRARGGRKKLGFKVWLDLCMLRSDPKAAWQGDESCVLMYPVYLRADRSNPPLSPASRDPARHRHPRVAACGQPCGIFRASLRLNPPRVGVSEV
jgi:hypothetical protein